MLWPEIMIRTDHNHWEEHSAVSKLLTNVESSGGSRNFRGVSALQKLQPNLK